jgi:hypothetical protein
MDQVENYIWIRNQFKGVELPDLRLVNRLEAIACRMMAKPTLSIPKQNKKWKDIKADYRFYDSSKVQFTRLIQPHISKTKKIAAKMKQILAIQDTCYISYGHHESVEGLSDIGGEYGSKGVILHTTLGIDPNSKHPEIIGLLDQYIHHRTSKVDKNETYSERQKRWRESKIWEESSQRISLKNSETQIIEVMDGEGDVFDIINNCLSLRHDFIVRAKNNRCLDEVDGKLFSYIQDLKSSGTIKLKVIKLPNQICREANLDVSYSNVKLKGPKSRKNEIIDWYKCRWIIEEYHKAIKSGCKVEDKQLKTRDRLENFLGVANVVALRILKLRDYARKMPEISAKKIIDPLKVDILIKYNDIKKEDITIKEYYREVAKIGGFIGRKSDGEPGWQALWQGETELNMLISGAKIALRGKTYG